MTFPDVIYHPAEWSQYFQDQQQAGQTPELLQSLMCLPRNSIRDARIAQCLIILNRYSEALQYTQNHPECALCRSLAFAVLAMTTEPFTLTLLLGKYSIKFPIGPDTTDFEARMRISFIRGTTQITLGNINEAFREFEIAQRYADDLGDTHMENRVHYEHARVLLNKGDWQRAQDLFQFTLSQAQQGTRIHNHVAESLIWTSVFQGQTLPLGTPEWAQLSWTNLMQFGVFALPASSPMPDTLQAGMALSALRVLMDHVNLHWPLYGSIPTLRADMLEMARGILDFRAETGDEISTLLLDLARGLALVVSTDGVQGLSVLQNALPITLQSVSLFQVLQQVAVLQALFLKPHLPVENPFDLNALRTQIKQLPLPERAFLDRFVFEFAWAVPFLVPLTSWELMRNRTLVVREDGAHMEGHKLSHNTYPKTALMRVLPEILSGVLLEENDVRQLRRHRKAMQSLSARRSLVQSLLDSAFKRISQ